MHHFIFIEIELLFLDPHLHFPSTTGFNKQVSVLNSLTLVTDHVDLRLNVVGVLFVRSQNDCDEVGYVIA